MTIDRYSLKESVAMTLTFFVSVWIGLASCAEYHIIPSPGHQCLVEPCFTLSTFVTGANLYLDSNTSLIFHPGNHLMGSQLIVINVKNFSMISYSTSAGIICDSSLTIQFDRADFIFEAVNHVYLNNINFYGCKHANVVITILIKVSLCNLVLLNCTFERTYIISARDSNVTISQTNFRDYDI